MKDSLVFSFTREEAKMLDASLDYLYSSRHSRSFAEEELETIEHLSDIFFSRLYEERGEDE